MKRLFFISIILLIACAIHAQSCYNETRSKGISFYNKGQYENAIKAFIAAKSCPDKPKNDDLNSWISKCKSKPAPTPPPPRVKTDTYIQVDGKSYTTLTKSSSGGNEIFYVSTDAKSWMTWGVPSWCSIENKKSGSFVLRVRANTSTSERSDYMEVRTPNGHSARINIKQSGKKETGPSAQIENVTVSHNQTISGEEGMTIKMKLHVHGLKDKDGQVAVYFYDENGVSLKDKNDKYNTISGDVATHDDIKPKYENSEWSEFKLSIPYRELHLTGNAGFKTVKFYFIVWDKSSSTSKNILSTSLYTTSFYFNPAFLTVDGSAFDKTKHFSESGGRETYYVKTSDSSYETWGVPSWCSIENKSSSSFTLVCNKNTSTSSRSDYMKVKAAGKEIRIDITQDANSGPSATINKLWVDHNVFNGLVKGMKIHIDLNVEGMKGRTVKYCVFFYKEDNQTKLINMYGNHISSSATATSDYENCHWPDWWIFVPYTNIFGAANSNGRFSLDVEIQNANGKLLKRQENYQFYQN